MSRIFYILWSLGHFWCLNSKTERGFGVFPEIVIGSLWKPFDFVIFISSSTSSWDHKALGKEENFKNLDFRRKEEHFRWNKKHVLQFIRAFALWWNIKLWQAQAIKKSKDSKKCHHAPWPTLDQYWEDNVTQPMLITTFIQVSRPEVHWGPRNKVGPLKLAERQVGFEPGIFLFICNALTHWATLSKLEFSRWFNL